MTILVASIESDRLDAESPLYRNHTPTGNSAVSWGVIFAGAAAAAALSLILLKWKKKYFILLLSKP